MRAWDLFPVEAILGAVVAFVGFHVTARLARPEQCSIRELRLWRAAFLGIALLMYVNGVYAKRETRLQPQRMLNAYAQRQLPKVTNVPAAFYFGDNYARSIQWGQQVRPTILLPFSFGIAPDGNLLIEGEIRDREGNVIAELRNSFLYPRGASLDYDSNSDLHALELVDSEGMPIFQVVVQDHPSAIQVYAVTYEHDQRGDWVTFCSPAGCNYRFRPQELKHYWTRLFEYPSIEHPGKRYTWDRRSTTPMAVPFPTLPPDYSPPTPLDPFLEGRGEDPLVFRASLAGGLRSKALTTSSKSSP